MRSENFVATGNLSVEENWRRVAIDVTHYGNRLFLSMVDCGPSRFAIWRRLQTESAENIVAQLRSVIIERGPCDELLMDNSMAFRSATVEEFAERWGISLRFRAAYAPGGNGIVERNHRTIKRIAERGGITPEEATFWYNVTPRKDIEEGSVPSNLLFRYPWRVPFDVNTRQLDADGKNDFAVGEEVWVKPSPPSCTKQWALGEVTSVNSKHTVCIDGVPRHVRDVRKRRHGKNKTADCSQQRATKCDPNDLGDTGPSMTDVLAGLPGDMPTTPLHVDRDGATCQQDTGTVTVNAVRPPAELPEADAGQPVVVAEQPMVQPECPAGGAEQPVVVAEQPMVQHERPQRVRRRPAYLDDYA
jgi:hypothetical protein